MGKISDALERHQNEREIKANVLHPQDRRETLAVRHRSFHPKLIALSAPNSLEAENFKTLRGQILFKKDKKRPKTILVTSALPGEGKTFVAANLAASIARGINEHALLVDCDLRKPDIHKMLGYGNEAGLQEFLTGKKVLSDLLIRTSINKLSLLTAGKQAPNPAELLSSSGMQDFFEEVKGRYQDRYIIVDSAPCHMMSEVNVLSNYIDGVIFVIRAQKAPREIIQKCIETMGRDKILGVIFNGYETINKGYDAYYKKYYKSK